MDEVTMGPCDLALIPGSLVGYKAIISAVFDLS
jgi:hypothetical protein